MNSGTLVELLRGAGQEEAVQDVRGKVEEVQQASEVGEEAAQAAHRGLRKAGPLLDWRF